MLKDKNIILGVTGGIAAYKAVEIASRLRKAGASVHVIMTRGAENFVTELTFREITGNPVVTTMWGKLTHHNVEHIALAQLADLILIAPATANILAKLAHGMADDMLTTTVLASKAPVLIAPAMNTNMYEAEITQENIARLEKRGFKFIEPDSGMLACGIKGIGRLPEPEAIVAEAERLFFHSMDYAGLRVLVTAAGTRENIDPVRYIGNRSSGKMGYAIAREARARGARVTLVTGPSALSVPEDMKVIKVETAREMQEAVEACFADMDVVIKAAAVSDYRVKNTSAQKIKKNDEELTLVLQKNPDILAGLGKRKGPFQTLVGFAAETENLLQYAKGKMEKKNLDMIVANDVSLPNAGFNTDTNIAKLLFKDGRVEECPLQSKRELAGLILERILDIRKNS